MVQSTLIGGNLLVINGSDTANFKDFMKAFDSSKVRAQIKNKKTDIMVQNGGGCKDINVYLYNARGFLNTRFVNPSINQIINELDTVQPSNQSGGGLSYKQKYLKYKQKCEQMEQHINMFKQYQGQRFN